MQYIETVRENDQVTDHYLCVSKQVLKTRAGKTYYSLRLQDKTGSLEAKIWDLHDGISHFEAGDYVKIDGAVVTFQGTLQLNIKRVRVSQEGEYNKNDYIPTSEYDINDMYKEFLSYLNEVENKYIKELLEKFFVEDKVLVKKFKEHGAAKTVHHNYFGGLLEHTLGILRTCKYLASAYPVVNKDYLYAGAMLHDIGKIEEMSALPLVEYTDEGQLLGHIVIATEWIHDKVKEIPGFPKKTENLIKHMVLSHHGELEYGSPKKPAILEAILLHYADNIDAKVKTVTTLLNQAESEDDWIGYQKFFETNLRRTR
ncbi:MAG: HD domain-containing protein [Vallitaleaceae bacterium]|nr:HD domain-containing protein [Vallitaleaceae bacterium]